ncbi:MAG: ZIP family metal transporter [Planctomycetota bacterium]|nr:ZIP family metal transporter [Planctomycetota bacterium]
MTNLQNHSVDVALWLVLLAVAAVAGALIPSLLRLGHRGMQIALSGVSGVLLGLACFHLVPHAIESLGGGFDAVEASMISLVVGFCAMFLLERFYCFHHHETPHDASEKSVPSAHSCGHDHASKAKHGSHVMAVGGAVFGLSVHGFLEGIALAAAIAAESETVRYAGFGTFLAIFLHKPFDSLTIAALMSRRGSSRGRIVIASLGLFLTIPVGMAVFFLGMSIIGGSVGIILGFAAGMFLCIATSDLLPELQFHDHDRVALSAALLIGIAIALGISKLEHGSHDHGVESHEGHSHLPSILQQ